MSTTQECEPVTPPMNQSSIPFKGSIFGENTPNIPWEKQKCCICAVARFLTIRKYGCTHSYICKDCLEMYEACLFKPLFIRQATDLLGMSAFTIELDCFMNDGKVLSYSYLLAFWKIACKINKKNVFSYWIVANMK